MASDNCRDYNKDEILLLSASIGRDEKAYQWLKLNCKELAALSDVLSYGLDDALDWLKSGSYLTLLAFIDAVDGNQQAAVFLSRGPYKEWALTAAAYSDQNEAKIILVKFQRAHYLVLSESIHRIIQKRGNENITELGIRSSLKSFSHSWE
jgi:hypothetical protein